MHIIQYCTLRARIHTHTQITVAHNTHVVFCCAAACGSVSSYDAASTVLLGLHCCITTVQLSSGISSSLCTEIFSF